jgi:hypothetical protein
VTQPDIASTGFKKSDWLWIALIGLIIQWGWASRLDYPTYMDAYYYTTNGQRLADGFGFTEMVVWQFLDAPAAPPTPSHSYWMPLPSILAAAGYRATSHFEGAQSPFWILAGLLPLLSVAISRHITHQRWQIWTAALFTASGGFYVNFFGQPSTFAPFAWAGGLCLLALAHASKPGTTWWWLLAGFMAGLAHLTRADGVLLLLIAILLWGYRLAGRMRKQDPAEPNALWLPVTAIAYLMIGYLLVMGGWFLRNLVVFGSPLSAVGTQTIFLTTYDDLFAYDRSFDFSHLLDWGWVNILRSRLQGISIAAQTFVAVSCFTFLTPFILWAWHSLRQQPAKWRWLRPMTWYCAALFITMSLVFTLPGGRGGLFHSSAALWPWFMTLAAAGIDCAVEWAAAKRSHWQPERAKRVFAGLFVAVGFVISLAVGLMRTSSHLEADLYQEIGEILPDTAVVMVGNAPGFHYHTGLPAISVPNEPVEVLLQAANKYHVTHLILDKDRPLPLAALYEDVTLYPQIEWVGDFAGDKLFALPAASEAK